MEHVIHNRQTTNGVRYNFDYAYNLAGGLETEAYPSGRTIKTCYDPASRITQVTGTKNAVQTTYASFPAVPSDAYWPHGAIKSVTRGDNLTESWAYNNERMQPIGINHDGDGRRVQKVKCPAGTNPCTSGSTGAQPTVYVYDAVGQLAAEYTVGWTPAASPCTTCYLTMDHLGSGRVLTDTTGVKERHDYAPFGRELFTGTRTSALGYASSAVGEVLKVGFTGKERDTELSSAAMQGLDYFGARYLSEAQGRFTSPDPVSGTVLHILSPQRWNMYTYAVNNPLTYLDPDGRVRLP